MKAGFDPKALSYLLVLIAGVSFFTLMLSDTGHRTSDFILPVGLILFGLYLGFLMFQIPICMKLGWYARGERLITGILPRVTDPRAEVTLLFHLFIFQFQQGRLPEAEETLERLSASDIPSEVRPLVDMNRASVFVAGERAEEALAVYRRYTVADFQEKQQAIFLNNLAFVYFLLGIELDDGIEMADRAFNLQPDPRFARTLAGLLFKTGSLEAAEAWCRYGLKKLPRAERIGRAWCWYIRALVRKELGDTEGVREAVKKGLTLSPLPKLTERLQALET